MSLRRLPCILLVPMIAALPACSSDHPAPATQQSTGATPGTARPVELDSLPRPVTETPELEIRTLSSWRPRTHVTWPRVPAAAGLDQALDRTARQTADAFTADHRDASLAELTTTWSLVAQSPSVVGVRLSSVEFGGASTGTSTQTLYGRKGSDRAWTGPDLVNDEGRSRIPDLVERAVRAAGWEPTPAADRGDLLSDVSFTEDGALVLVADKGEIAPSDRGMVQLTLPRDQTDALLSDAGRAVRDAVTGASSPSARPSTPAATPSPVASSPTTPTVDCRTAKCIALTFDDGPGPLTDGILDALAARKARATFFVLGPQAQANPAVVRRAHELGMAIGNHSWTHADLARLGSTGATRELARTSDVIRQVTGAAPVAARPPYGSFVKATPHAGLPFVLWDVDTEDWKNRNSATTTQRALAGAHPGAIILMHDIHPSTAKAVPGLVKTLQDKGYTLVTVPELLGTMSPTAAYYSGRA